MRSALAVGSTASREAINRVCCLLIELWSSPGRHFHGTAHLYDLLARIDSLAVEAQNADVVRLAAWGHGLVFSTDGQAIYTRNGGEDRGASAALMAKYLDELGVPADTVEEIRQLILHMRKHPVSESGMFESHDMDLLVLTDAHLGFLANQPQKYKTYMEKVRAEYAHIPELRFLEGRLEVVTRLLGRRRIFATPLATQWEDSARQNLELERQRLLVKLQRTTGTIPAIKAELGGGGVASAGAVSSAQEPAGGPDGTASAGVNAPAPAGPGEAAPAADPVDAPGSGPARSDSVEPRSTASAAPAPAPSQTEHAGSSLETASEDLDPGMPGRTLTPEEVKQARRDEIARATLEKIERAKAAKEAQRARERAREGDFPSGLVE
ncbi:HD domain-containing protein [Trueperella abortisuis]|uniref:Metal-dependent HD superfamily phosphohydrolase n=1 Tax=Trueperella abortisuis TaxID=445930 RepID=A0ABT9PHI7_9ACTO|nr:hypothetical protein [Trueperella abortisuis]MDP9831615.1 putative metal-dependent HD superfamily phosphohydrolase [Trueperella abortisuis]